MKSLLQTAKVLSLFLNPAAVKVIGKPITEIVGRNVRELVDEGFFKPSVTVEVIRQRRQVNLIQTSVGRKICSLYRRSYFR